MKPFLSVQGKFLYTGTDFMYPRRKCSAAAIFVLTVSVLKIDLFWIVRFITKKGVRNKTEPPFFLMQACDCFVRYAEQLQLPPDPQPPEQLEADSKKGLPAGTLMNGETARPI